ncbi:ABC transporter permease [Amycolatopsis rhabdoformis]|uniref:ABC transporter permease n=1 Tax=Amycolatopsis rhabdoformis TaxID=1448059 RepID=A0ABZ1I7M1_9PSEU|nr:ABC transporter permease [Amycolatopsis rhabdoformis]WSE29696.1 ABC transporter permease [Amycolatopsis rhabdoformis]
MTTAQAPARAGGGYSGGGLSGAVASEWTKLWSVRGTWWSLAGGVLLMLLYSTVSGLSQQIDDSGATQGPHDIVVGGAIYLTEFCVIAVATLFVTSEYASGSIRSTLQWVPVRSTLVAAKAAVLVPVLFAYGVVVSVLGMAVSGVLMPNGTVTTTFGDGLTAAAGMGAYFALLGVLCAGIGFALRSAAGTIVVVMVLLLPLPMLLSAYVAPEILNYFPAFAGINGMVPAGDTNPMMGGIAPYSPIVGVLICLVWAAAGLFIGTSVLKKRDA